MGDKGMSLPKAIAWLNAHSAVVHFGSDNDHLPVYTLVLGDLTFHGINLIELVMRARGAAWRHNLGKAKE